MLNVVMLCVTAAAVLMLLVAIGAPAIAARIRDRQTGLVQQELARVRSAVEARAASTGRMPVGVSSSSDGRLAIADLAIALDARVVVDLVGDGFDVLVTCWHRSTPWRTTSWSSTIGAPAAR